MFKTLRTPLILFILSSPLIFLDLYSKHLAHKHITSEDKEIVLSENIALVIPLINKGWALQDPNTVTIWTTILRNIALSFLSIFFLLGALEGGTLYERILARYKKRKLDFYPAKVICNTGVNILFLYGIKLLQTYY